MTQSFTISDSDEEDNVSYEYFVANYAHFGLRCKPSKSAMICIAAAFETLEEAQKYSVELQAHTKRDSFLITRNRPTIIPRDYRFMNGPEAMKAIEDKVQTIVDNYQANEEYEHQEYKENKDRKMKYEDHAEYEKNKDMEKQKYADLLLARKKDVVEGKAFLKKQKSASKSNSDDIDESMQVCGNAYALVSILQDTTETELSKQEPVVIVYGAYPDRESAQSAIEATLQHRIKSYDIHILKMHYFANPYIVLNPYISENIEHRYRNSQQNSFHEGVAEYKRNQKELKKKLRREGTEVTKTLLTVHEDGTVDKKCNVQEPDEPAAAPADVTPSE